MNTFLRWGWALLLLLAGVAVGVAVQQVGWLGSGSHDAETVTDKKIAFYRHPMNPAITADQPLKDDMGMDYIPVYEGGDATAAAAGTVTVSSTMMQNMGVRTAPVQRSALVRSVEGVGYVSLDEDTLRREHVRVEGWVERLHVNFVGQQVHKGDLLFELYAPKLVSASQEYVQALSVDNPMLQRAARERLLTLGLSAGQVAGLERSRQVPRLSAVYAQHAGIVQNLNIRPGVYVEPGMEVLALADLSSVWLLVDVFGQQASSIKSGVTAEIRFDDFPGKRWQGEVDYVYPNVTDATRTLKVRLRLANPDLQLKPNMYASVRFKAGTTRAALQMPVAALIRTGAGERVIVALSEGKFAQRTVVAGVEAGDQVEIIDGLTEGEIVVTSGQFLIDSEASLTASLERLSSPEPGAPMAAAKKTAHASGVINAINGDTINISHPPIAEFNWPAMTMDFKLKGDATTLQPGMQIRFDLHQDNGDYVVENVTPQTGAAP